MFETSGSEGMEVVDLNFESLRDLQEEFGPFLSTEGFFLSGRSDFAASDVLRFRLMLPGDFVLIEGIGVAVWVRSPEDATPKLPFGVAVGFATLSDQGRELVERIVQSHVESGGKPFDMSRPSDGPEQELPGADSEEAAAGTSRMKFTVREEQAAEPEEIQGPAEVEPRLPFEESRRVEVATDHEPEPLPEMGVPEVVEDVDPVDEPEMLTLELEEPEVQEVHEASLPGPTGFEAAEVYEDQPESATEEEPGRAFEVSLPDPPAAPAEPQTLWDTGTEEFDGNVPSKPKSRTGLTVMAAVVILSVAAAWVVWTQFPDLLPWNGTSADPVVSESTGTDSGELPPDAIGGLTEEDLEAAVEAAVDAATGSEEPAATKPAPEPVETAPQTVTDAVSAPASRIVDIKAEAAENSTVILVRADGSIESRRVLTSHLSDPARILVRISGIESPFRPFEIPVVTNELNGIRIGHHMETRPPSLWIVLDRADGDVEIRDTQSSGNVVRLEIGR